MKNDLRLSGVILAGGESRRMGRDKARLELNGRSLLSRATATMREVGIREIFISGRAGEDYSEFGLSVLVDRQPKCGPMGGIERGLSECSSPLLLVLAVDLPRMTPAFLRKLINACDGQRGVVPRLHGRLEPLAAVYPKRCHAAAAESIATGRHAAREFAEICLRQDAVRLFEVDPEDAVCFANWNSPEDACL